MPFEIGIIFTNQMFKFPNQIFQKILVCATPKARKSLLNTGNDQIKDSTMDNGGNKTIQKLGW